MRGFTEDLALPAIDAAIPELFADFADRIAAEANDPDAFGPRRSGAEPGAPAELSARLLGLRPASGPR